MNLHVSGRRASPARQAAAVIALSCTAAAAARAQHAEGWVDLQSTRLRFADTVEATAQGISPALRISWPLASLAISGTAAELSRAWSVDATANGSLFTPSRRGISGELAATAGGSTHQDGTHTGIALGTLRLHADGAAIGAWIGAGAGATWDGAAWRPIRQGELGVWTGSRLLSLTLAAEPTVISDSIRYTDLAAEADWTPGRLEVGAVAGGRTGASRLPALASDARTWGSLSLAAWLTDHAALVVAAGTYPVDYAQGFPGGRFASLGLRIGSRPRIATEAPPPQGQRAVSQIVPADVGAPERGRVRLARARAGAYIEIFAPGARTVQVNGDFTAWSPVALHKAPSGWWRMPGPAQRGTYQMVIRIDGGAWQPPAGVPVVRDEFGGASGAVTVQ